MNLSQEQLRSLFTQWYEGAHPTISHFSAGEILSTCQNKKKGVYNSVPPIHLWANILPTIHLLDAVRKELGYPLYLNSVHRNPAYNKAIGGSPKSMHMRFNAIDFCGKRGKPKDWAEAVMVQRTLGVSVGGVGTYPGFVHADTRDNWKGRVHTTWTG